MKIVFYPLPLSWPPLYLALTWIELEIHRAQRCVFFNIFPSIYKFCPKTCVRFVQRRKMLPFCANFRRKFNSLNLSSQKEIHFLTFQSPLIVVFHQKASATEGHLPPKVAFHQRLSSNKVHLSPKAVFHCRSSSTKGCLPPKIIFHQRSSSTEGYLPSKVLFHLTSSSTEGRHPPTITPLLISYLGEQSTSTYQISSSYVA